MSSLKDSQAEFLEFLATEEPALLNIGVNSDEELDSDEEGDGLHQAKENLDSDEEDMSSDDEGKGPKKSKKAQIVVTEKIIEKWTSNMVKSESSSLTSFKELTQAYHGCVLFIEADDVQEKPTDKSGKKKKNKRSRLKDPSLKYKIVSNEVFDSLISTCMKNVAPALEQILGYDSKKSMASLKKRKPMPASCKRWPSVRDALRVYLNDVMSLIQGFKNDAVVLAYLTHIKTMLPYYLSLPKVCRKLADVLVKLWSQGSESVRVSSFLCLHNIVRLDKKRMFEDILKQMYLSYVANCKFVSVNTLQNINFMKKSFSLMCMEDSEATYRFAFLYIRQLAVHLRKAMVDNNITTRKAVYNWQYVHCVSLWCRVIAEMRGDKNLYPLIFPLGQVATGIINLQANPRFYPLRFHVIRDLIELCDHTNQYIPLLPFITAPLLLQEFQKKQVGVSMKPVNFECILKLSNSQLKDKSYRDQTMEQVNDLLMKFFNTQAHTIAFPEMAVSTIILLKKFVKDCQTMSYSKMMRQLIEKVEFSTEFIVKKRSSVDFGVTDCDAVDNWEYATKLEGVPFNKHYAVYAKKRQRELHEQLAGVDKTVERSLPTVDREKFIGKMSKDADRVEFSELFNSGEDVDFDLDFAVQARKNKEREIKKSKRKRDAEKVDDDDETFGGGSSDEGEDEEEDNNDSHVSDGEMEVDDASVHSSDDDDEEELDVSVAPPVKVAAPKSAAKSKTPKKVVATPVKKQDDGADSDAGSDVVGDFDMEDF